jgi:hypothetical protein
MRNHMVGNRLSTNVPERVFRAAKAGLLAGGISGSIEGLAQRDSDDSRVVGKIKKGVRDVVKITDLLLTLSSFLDMSSVRNGPAKSAARRARARSVSNSDAYRSKMARDVTESGDVRFIRKNGRVIPIGGASGSSGSSGKKKSSLPARVGAALAAKLIQKLWPGIGDPRDGPVRNVAPVRTKKELADYREDLIDRMTENVDRDTGKIEDRLWEKLRQKHPELRASDKQRIERADKEFWANEWDY